MLGLKLNHVSKWATWVAVIWFVQRHLSDGLWNTSKYQQVILVDILLSIHSVIMLHDERFSVQNIKIYIYFQSLIDIKMKTLISFLMDDKKVYPKYFKSWLHITMQGAWYQQPWYWTYSPEISRVVCSTGRGRVSRDKCNLSNNDTLSNTIHGPFYVTLPRLDNVL